MANKELWQALADGKEIEARTTPWGKWIQNCNWDAELCYRFFHQAPVAAAWEFRIKPRTITINGREVPEPLRVPPSQGAPVWLVGLMEVENHAYQTGFERYIELGLMHLTEAAAISHREALLSCSAQVSE